MGKHLVFAKFKDKFFLRFIKRRIEQNKNFMGVITGETGSGKSYTALRFAIDLDPNFTVENVVFDNKAFNILLDSGRLKRGSVIVYDEAGVGMNHNEWMSEQNTLMAKVLQTFRHRNIIVFFTTPNMSFLTADSRRLVHCHLETAGIDFKKKLVKVKPFFLQINQYSGKVYTHQLRVNVHHKGVFRLRTTSALIPPDDILTAYEAKKKAFTDELYKTVIHRLNNTEEKALKTSKQKPKTPEEPIEEPIIFKLDNCESDA